MIEVNISCPNVESRGQVFACDADRVVAGDRRGAPGGRPDACRSSPSSRPTSPTSRQIARAVRRRRRGRLLADQHPAGHGDRHRHDAPGARRGHRRAVRPGDPAGRGALRVAGAPGACRTCRSSAWAASAPAWTRCSSSWPARRRCRSAPRSSATRPRRCGSWPSWRRRWTSAASPRSPTRSASRTAPPARAADGAAARVGDRPR